MAPIFTKLWSKCLVELQTIISTKFFRQNFLTKYVTKFGSHIELDSYVTFRATFVVKFWSKLYTNFLGWISGHTLNQFLRTNIGAKSWINKFGTKFLELISDGLFGKGLENFWIRFGPILLPKIVTYFLQLETELFSLTISNHD